MAGTLCCHRHAQLPELLEALRTERKPPHGSRSPHNYKLMQDGGLEKPKFKKRWQLHIDENIFNL